MDSLYPWLKGIHVASIVAWLGALTTNAVLLGLSRDAALRPTLAPVARRLYTRVQSAGFGLTLVTGIAQLMLYIQDVPGWMKVNIWLHYKLMFVLALAVVDHIIMRRVLGLKRRPDETPKPVVLHLALTAAFALAAILLATVQPIR